MVASAAEAVADIAEEQIDPDLINAGKETVTAAPGHAYFTRMPRRRC